MQVILVPLTWKSASHLREGWRWSRSSPPADAPMLRAWASTGRGTEGRDAPSLRHPRVLWRPGVPQRPSVWDHRCGFTMILILAEAGAPAATPSGHPKPPPLPRVLQCQSSTTAHALPAVPTLRRGTHMAPAASGPPRDAGPGAGRRPPRCHVAAELSLLFSVCALCFHPPPPH